MFPFVPSCCSSQNRTDATDRMLSSLVPGLTLRAFGKGCLYFFGTLAVVFFGHQLVYYNKDAPYVPTTHAVSDRMLELASVDSSDTVYDLGSGDGRIPVMAADQHGARAYGLEIDSSLVVKSRQKAETYGVDSLVTFYNKDLFNADLQDATVVTLFLFQKINLKLRPMLLRVLDPGDRIVSHTFDMGEWEPDSTIVVEHAPPWEDSGIEKADLYLWRVPENPPPRLLQSPN